MTTFSEVFQGCLRKNPEAFFSKRVMVCEGATEVGICSAINFNELEKNNKSFSLLGIAIVDGSGASFIDYCLKFKEAGFEVAALCDSDDSAINSQKTNLISKGITVFDWDNGLGLENQIFLDLPWTSVQALIDYAYELRGEQSVLDLIKNNVPGNQLRSDWYKSEDNDLRIALVARHLEKRSKTEK